MDPYKVLGILPHSTFKEVTEAYKNIVATYSTDDLEDESVKSFYLEKLSEANEAYRIINLNLTCQEVRGLIEEDNFIAAETKLNLTSDLSSAEWNYLKGILLIKKGWVDSGINHVKRAATLNPYNSEYINTTKQLDENVKQYKNSFSRNSGQKGGLNLCNNSNTENKNNGLC